MPAPIITIPDIEVATDQVQLVSKYVSPGITPATAAGSALVFDHHDEEFGGAMRYSVSRHVWDVKDGSLVNPRVMKPRYFASAVAAEAFAHRWIVRRFGERLPILGHLRWICDYYVQAFVSPDTILS